MLDYKKMWLSMNRVAVDQIAVSNHWMSEFEQLSLLMEQTKKVAGQHQRDALSLLERNQQITKEMEALEEANEHLRRKNNALSAELTVTEILWHQDGKKLKELDRQLMEAVR